ncbi:hypothetical protein HY502_02385, partial [Candidatus Woesebacteria bacterium]|nr:hypothetical protein [Candidatus Woesebacteria bacterium]
MRLIHFILLFGIYSLANFQTLGFYFWHDDFSSFYGPLLNQCIHGWPYYGFCTVFDWLVKAIGYTPFPYFLIGNVLGFTSVVLFYFFVQSLFENKKVALGAAGLLASSYIASGVFLEAWDPIASYTTLAGLFASLIICVKAISKKFSPRLFGLAVAALSLSLSIFNFRAATNFIPFIMLLLLFTNKKISLKSRLVLSTGVLLLSVFFLFALPLKILRQPLDSFWPSINLWKVLTSPDKISYLFQTLSSFIFPDYLHFLVPPGVLKSIQTFLGVFLSVFFLLYSLLNRKDKFTKIRSFAVIWVLALFIPYWMRNNFYLNSTHRYILWLLPGVLIAWATFFQKRIWWPITIAVIAINVFQVHKFYGAHLQKSKQRQNFYTELHKSLPTLPEGSVLFFAYPPNIKATLDDFFRVGFTPPESALGTEFRVNYQTIDLITEDEAFRRFFAQNPSKANSLYSFFYDGGSLVNTTAETKNLIGKTFPLDLALRDLSFPVPGYLNLTVTASLPKISLPYEQDCPACSEIPERGRYLKYLTASRKLKTAAEVKAEEAFENTVDQAMLDDNKKTYWLFNRRLWHQGDLPQVVLTFTRPYELSGINLFSSYASGLPTEAEILIDGKKVPNRAEAFTGGTRILFKEQKVEEIIIRVFKTQGGDSAFINELDFIPGGFDDINPVLADEVREFPIKKIKTQVELSELREYLENGTKACLRWLNKYGQKE